MEEKIVISKPINTWVPQQTQSIQQPYSMWLPQQIKTIQQPYSTGFSQHIKTTQQPYIMWESQKAKTTQQPSEATSIENFGIFKINQYQDQQKNQFYWTRTENKQNNSNPNSRPGL